MWARISKVICVALFGMMLLDGIADAAGCDDTKGAATVCHACACAAHVVPRGVVQVALVPVRATFVALELPEHVSPAPKSLLRPPCLAA